MNPFLPGDQGPPPPPLDFTAPETPPPDFVTIGEAAGVGIQKLAFGGGIGKWISDNLAKWVRIVVSTLINFIFTILTYFMSFVFSVFNRTDTAMNNLAAAGVAGMFGVNRDPSAYASVSGRDARKAAATDIASTIINAIGAGQPAGGTIHPGHEGAQKFLETTTHMVIEGWLMGWMADAASYHWFERFGDLKDTLEQSLGMGRLARRVLGPPVKVLIEDPYTQELNQTWHPTLLSPAELVRQYLRIQTPAARSDLQAAMNLHGYDSTKVDALIFDQLKSLSMAEIQDLIARNKFTGDDALSALEHQGYDESTARLALDVASFHRNAQWERRAVEEALGFYKDGRMDRPTFDNVLGQTNLTDDEKNGFRLLATVVDLSHARPKKHDPIRASVAEGLKLLEKKIWTLAQYEDLLNHYNYIPSDEFDLAQLASEETVDYQTLQAKKAAAEAARAQREADRLKKAQMMVEDIGVSTLEMETLVYEGLRTIPQYQQYLLNKSVAPDNVQALTAALLIKLATKAAAAAAKAAAAGKAKSKNLDVTQLETAVQQGLLTLADFTTRMEQLGMSKADAELLAQELQHRIDAAATKAKTTADAKAAAAVKHVDLSQEERAVLLGTQTIAQYSAFLDSKGFDPTSRDVLVSDLQARLDQAQATAAKKAAAAKTGAARGINLTQLERLVRAGIKTTADYQAALANLGYSPADQADLVQYLQLQMEQDQQNLITKGHAADLVGQLGVSLTDLERAVKLSVVPIATYQDALQRAGVPAADQQTLVRTLAAEIKTTRAQQTAAQSVSKQVAAAGLNLATLEKDTENGRLSIEQFQALLAGYGVPESQVTDVVQLVEDVIANQRAVQALIAQATARAAAKGLNLSQDTAAYKAGVMTETEWRSRVASLGYDAADVEILFETLAAAQAAAAAKSAKKTTTPTTTTAPTGTSTAPAG